jgi:hypothetical protein
MIINKHYIQGILEATLEVYEIENGRIERDKDLRFTVIEKSNYIEVKFTCKIELSSKWNIDNTYHENSINIYEADTLSGFIADIQSELSEIHSKTINYL